MDSVLGLHRPLHTACPPACPCGFARCGLSTMGCRDGAGRAENASWSAVLILGSISLVTLTLNGHVGFLVSKCETRLWPMEKGCVGRPPGRGHTGLADGGGPGWGVGRNLRYKGTSRTAAPRGQSAPPPFCSHPWSLPHTESVSGTGLTAGRPETWPFQPPYVPP